MTVAIGELSIVDCAGQRGRCSRRISATATSTASAT
jgi:hypothetical protein